PGDGIPWNLVTTDNENSRGLAPVLEITRLWTSSTPRSSVEVSVAGWMPSTGGATPLPASATGTSLSSGSLLMIASVPWNDPTRSGPKSTETAWLSPTPRLNEDGFAVKPGASTSIPATTNSSGPRLVTVRVLFAWPPTNTGP